MRRRLLHPRLYAFALTLAGVYGAHWLSYRLVVPGHAHRHDILHQTGHGYLQYLAPMSLMFAAVFLGVAVRAGYRMAHHPTRVRPVRLVFGLFAVQVVIFIGMEFAERLFSGAAVTDLLHSALLPLGVLFQLLMAIVAAVLFYAALHAGAVLARLFCRTPVTFWHTPASYCPPLGVAVYSTHTTRGPPRQQPLAL